MSFFLCVLFTNDNDNDCVKWHFQIQEICGWNGRNDIVSKQYHLHFFHPHRFCIQFCDGRDICERVGNVAMGINSLCTNLYDKCSSTTTSWIRTCTFVLLFVASFVSTERLLLSSRYFSFGATSLVVAWFCCSESVTCIRACTTLNVCEFVQSIFIPSTLKLQ